MAAGKGKARFRRYRVQASVSLFSVPVIWKDGVGAAELLVEEASRGSERFTAVQFAGGSWPERIKGFNRFGMTQELLREEDGAIRESRYLSFMTSSPEKSSDQAWRAFAERPRILTLAVASGAASEAEYKWKLDHQNIPAEDTWLDCPALMEKFGADKIRPEARAENLRIEAASSIAGVSVAGVSSMANDAQRDTVRDSSAAHPERVHATFLHAARRALLRRSESRSTFIHNAKLYDLHARFAETDGSVIMTGRFVERGSSSESEFRVWLDDADPAGLPVKIEFRPKSFLRLTFHADPNAGGPALRRLLVPEEA